MLIGEDSGSSYIAWVINKPSINIAIIKDSFLIKIGLFIFRYIF